MEPTTRIPWPASQRPVTGMRGPRRRTRRAATSVVGKVTRAMQRLPASADAFVWPSPPRPPRNEPHDRHKPPWPGLQTKCHTS
jgi:hypothetical protein